MKNIHAAQALMPDGWRKDVIVRIADDGRIEDVGAAGEQSDGASAQKIDLLLPAPTNLHSHAFQRAMAGLTETRGPDPSDSFWTWRRLMYRFLDRLTPEHVEAIAGLVFMEMLEAGYGSVAEFHYLHHDRGGAVYGDLAEMSGRIIAAAERAGIGLTLLPVHYEFGGCDRRALEGGQRRFGNDVARFGALHQAAARKIEEVGKDYAIGVAPHSLRAVDPEGLTQAVALAGAGPLHMHLAEQVAEVEEVEAYLGARPVEWLLNAHDVTARWCLIHCTQMTASETAALAASGAVAGLCPITESSLGDGIFRGTEYLGASGRLGIGSDSNVDIALFGELRVLEYSQRLRDRSRAALATAERSTGRVLFDAAAQGGAQAAGRASGRIEEGCWADFVGVQSDNYLLNGQAGDTALDTLIFGAHGQSCITDVWSAGRHVVEHGQHREREKIVQAYRAAMRDLGEAL
ncbi:formimidoylglutamate deiminase [Aquicoccus sp. G2-2]|uniref:formimidoylglutamate deiminase n=1 Tax=Aquicoccus sp. G2-2 TaxID=3092120 RepID=UPI002AE08C13|nr:formimidoylglutamate deiminase [Aquicoccus sp. G2-2]MEA1114491.1 formimidoylglutamate deiminase [Aquicoccus sp. G2-2]